MAHLAKKSLNELLVNLFNHVMDLEAKAVITEEYRDITNNDMHIIEAIGVEEHDTGERHFYRQYRSFQFLA